MLHKLNYAIFYLQCLTAVISFLFSLKLVRNKNIPLYMKGFYWYSFVGLLVIVPLFLQATIFPEQKIFSNTVNNISLIFHYSFLGVFIIKILALNKNVKFEIAIFFIFLIFILFSLLSNSLSRQLNFGFSICNLGLTILSFFYFIQLFNIRPTFNLKKEPAFWIITGVFFCMSTHLPITAMVDYLRNKVSPIILIGLNNVVAFCFIIMHIFFIKAYLCATHHQKV